MASEPCRSCKEPEKTIDDCYNQVIKKLTAQGKIKEVSSHLMSLATNHERVLYVYSILEELSALPRIHTNQKDDRISVYYRNHGNFYYKQKKYYEAWQSYNLSLLYAVTTSENFIYAISNRSATFYGMGKYKECLEDIKYVSSTQLPEKLKDKLYDRRKQCLSKLVTEESNDRKEYVTENIKEVLKLKGPRDKKYIHSSSKLKVVYTTEMGRHVIANEDIAVGEVLVEEESYLTILLQSQFLFCCAHCLSRSMNLYPCMQCTYSLYCSEECRDTAFGKYHSVECGLLASILAMKFSKMDLLALRAVIRSRTEEGDWLAVFKTAEEAESRSNTDLWGCVKRGDDDSWIYSSKYYSPIHTLATNVEKRSISDIFRKSLYAAVLTHFLSIAFFEKSADNELALKVKRYVSGTLLLHIMTSPTNMHSISTMIVSDDGKYVDECHIASGAYPYLSLFNHSCAPSVVRYSRLGTAQMALIAIRPIKKGMQVFDNYGYHHAVQDLETRQSDLKFQYKFTCACEACINNWPLHANLKEVKRLPTAIVQKKDECLATEVIEKLMMADKNTAFNLYQPLCELITVLDSFAPCKELAECQEALKQCLAIFHGVVPFELSKTLEWNTFPPCESTGGPPHVWSCDLKSVINSQSPHVLKTTIDT